MGLIEAPSFTRAAAAVGGRHLSLSLFVFGSIVPRAAGVTDPAPPAPPTRTRGAALDAAVVTLGMRWPESPVHDPTDELIVATARGHWLVPLTTDTELRGYRPAEVR